MGHTMAFWGCILACNVCHAGQTLFFGQNFLEYAVFHMGRKIALLGAFWPAMFVTRDKRFLGRHFWNLLFFIWGVRLLCWVHFGQQCFFTRDKRCFLGRHFWNLQFFIWGTRWLFGGAFWPAMFVTQDKRCFWGRHFWNLLFFIWGVRLLCWVHFGQQCFHAGQTLFFG